MQINDATGKTAINYAQSNLLDFPNRCSRDSVKLSSAITRLMAKKNSTKMTTTKVNACRGILITKLSSDISLPLRYYRTTSFSYHKTRTVTARTRLIRSAKFSEDFGEMEPLPMPSSVAKILGEVNLMICAKLSLS